MTKKRISWDNAAQLIEYATSQDLQIIDEETNQRIVNLLKTNTQRRNDLIVVLRKRMMYNQYDNVISLALHLINKIVVECPDCVTFFSTVDWQQVFISLLFNRTASTNRIQQQSSQSSLSLTTKVNLLHLIVNLKESFPNDLLFEETYNMIKLLGVTFPRVDKTFVELIDEQERQMQNRLFEESNHLKVNKEQLLAECDELIGICADIDESLNYLTLIELDELKNNADINEKIAQLEQAQHILTLLLRRKTLSPEVIDTLRSTHHTILLILEKHQKLAQRWTNFISSSHPIVENTQFLYQLQQKK